jgi:hypothetical protein
MIEAQLRRSAGILLIEPRGTLEETDFERLRLLVDPYVEQNGPLNGILFFANSFAGWEDLSAMLAHLRFLSDHREQVQRVAVLGNGLAQTLLPRLSEWFTSAEVRAFSFADRSIAEAWLGGEDTRPADS